MSVHFDNGHNSTLFTDCCDVAITDEEKYCPRCGEHIIEGRKTRWDIAMKRMYGIEGLKRIRENARKKYGA